MIRYNFEEIGFKLKNRRKFSAWIKSVIISEGKVLGDINYIFCSDDYLLNINKQFLHHDYYTDIITFDYCEAEIISGDLFISIDSVKDNSKIFNVSFEEELKRVMVHGVLHLLKYDDHCEKDIAEMRNKENYYIAKYE